MVPKHYVGSPASRLSEFSCHVWKQDTIQQSSNKERSQCPAHTTVGCQLSELMWGEGCLDNRKER